MSIGCAALELARQGEVTSGANVIGCVIVRDDVMLAESHNECGIRHDPTAHAEIVAIRRACEALAADDLRGATLYSILQPCGMCTMAMILAKLGRVVYGAKRGQVHEMYFEDCNLDTMGFIRDDLSVTGGVLALECVGFCVPAGALVPKSELVNL